MILPPSIYRQNIKALNSQASKCNKQYNQQREKGGIIIKSSRQFLESSYLILIMSQNSGRNDSQSSRPAPWKSNDAGHEQQRRVMEEEDLFLREIQSGELESQPNKNGQSPHRATVIRDDPSEGDNSSIQLGSGLVGKTGQHWVGASRLMIFRVTLQNFKSYAGIQTLGPFHKQFTSVVGPNGSGKSNLIESLLFIFGFSASWMRQSRLSELIHRSHASNHKQASVEVEFRKISQNGQSSPSEVLEQFRLKRTISISNVSKYYLNDIHCTHQEVKIKLRNEGIDLDTNRFLILQGEVEHIASMQQKSDDLNRPGLLEYLEEIIGSNASIGKIKQLSNVYARLQQVRHTEGQKMRAVERELMGIDQQKVEAIYYAKTEDIVNKSENILLQIGIAQEGVALEKINMRYQQLLVEKDETVAKQKQKLQQELKRIKEITQNKKRIEDISKSIRGIKEEVNNLQNADKKMREDIAFKIEDIAKFNRQIAEIDLEIQETTKEGEKAQLGLQQLEQKLGILGRQHEELNNYLAEYDRPELEIHIRELQRMRRTKFIHIKCLTSRLETVHKKYNESLQAMKANDQRERRMEQKVGISSQFLMKILQAMQKVGSIKQHLLANLRQYKDEQEQLKIQLQQVERNTEDIKKEMTQRQQTVFSKIMEQNIMGVYGRLGDLGTTSDEFDQIVTSCIGPQIDSIVVENMEAATAVIQYFKSTKMGRVSYIILDEIKDLSGYMYAQNFLPKESSRVFDMVQSKFPEISVAFYFVLKETIYVDDPALGLRIAMQNDNRRRVICPKKNGYIIIQTNGLMSGIPAKKRGFLPKGNLSKQRNGRELKQLEGIKFELQIKMKEIEQKKQAAEKEVAAMQADFHQLSMKQSTLQNEIKVYIEQIQDDKKSTYTRANQSYQQFASQKKEQLERDQGVIQAQIKQTQIEIKQISDLICQAEQKRRGAQSEEVNNKRAEHRQRSEQLCQLTNIINHRRAVIAKVFIHIPECRKRRDRLVQRVSSIEGELSKIRQQQKKIEEAAVQKYAMATQLQMSKLECQTLGADMRVLLAADNEEVAMSKQKIEIAIANLEKCSREKSAKEQQIGQIRKQLHQARERRTKNQRVNPQMTNYNQVEMMCLRGNKNKQSGPKDDSLRSTIEMVNRTDPAEDFSQQEIGAFLLFQQAIIQILRSHRQKLASLLPVNLSIIETYKTKYLDYLQKRRKFQQIAGEQEKVRENIEKLKKERLDSFTAGFRQINSKLREIYQFLTNGGDATLDLIDSLDPFSDGIKFSVRPPKKAWKEINKLSGGEKTLSSLSLIFALHEYSPNPVYFMDEIDAALDYRNVSVVGQYIKKRARNAQFIVISLRNNMFELSDKLMGIFKVQDKTKVLHYQMEGETEDLDELNVDQEEVIRNE